MKFGTVPFGTVTVGAVKFEAVGSWNLALGSSAVLAPCFGAVFWRRSGTDAACTRLTFGTSRESGLRAAASRVTPLALNRRLSQNRCQDVAAFSHLFVRQRHRG